MISTSIPQAVARAANHCEELLGAASAAPDLADGFARFVRDLAEQSRSPLAALCDDASLETEVIESGPRLASDWLAAVDAGGIHTFHAADGSGPGFVVSTPICEIAARFDRILGGPGNVDQACRVLPASAARFARQFDGCMSDALTCAGRRTTGVAATSDAVHDISPFAADETVWALEFEVRPAGATRGWPIRIAATQDTIADIVGAGPAAPTNARSIGSRGLAGSAIGEMEMPLRAVLVDLPVSVASLARLSTGSMIPVAVQRSVPVMIGDTTIAHGTVGELDDRVALELTQISVSGE